MMNVSTLLPHSAPMPTRHRPNTKAAQATATQADPRWAAVVARRLRADCAFSKARCSLLFRLAAVKCTRPSCVSADGLTVAAFAVHMGEAEYAQARITGDSL